MKRILWFLILISFVTYAGEKSFMPPHPKFQYNNELKRSLGIESSIKKDTVRLRNFATTIVNEEDPKPKLLVLLVEFEEESDGNGGTMGKHIFSRDKAYYEDMISNKMRDYYQEVSYEKYDFEVEVKDWITIDNKYSTDENRNKLSYFGENVGSGIDNAGSSSRLRELVKSAIIQTFESNTDDLNTMYDSNPKDDYLDHLIIVHAGSGEEESGVSTDLWSHRWDIEDEMTYGDGDKAIKFFNYTMQAEDSGLGIFAHEFGHDLGLVDLYNTSTGTSVVGSYSLMDKGSWNGPTGMAESPAHMTAVEKKMLGWVEEKTISVDGIYSIKAIEKLVSEDDDILSGQGYAYRINLKLNEKEYLSIEYRQKKGYDSYIPGSGGMLIYHVYEDYIGAKTLAFDMSSNSINNNFLKRLKVLEADGSDNLGVGNSGEIGDYYRDNNYSLYPYENNNPNTCYWIWTLPETYSGGGAYSGNSGVRIVNISAELPDNSMSFEFKKDNYSIVTNLENGLKLFSEILSFTIETNDSTGNPLDFVVKLNGEELLQSGIYNVALNIGVNIIIIEIEGGYIEQYAVTVISTDIDSNGIFDGEDMKVYISSYELGDNSWDIDGDQDLDIDDFDKFKIAVQEKFENIKFW